MDPDPIYVDAPTGTLVFIFTAQPDKPVSCASCSRPLNAGDRAFDLFAHQPIWLLIGAPRPRLLFHTREELIAHLQLAATRANEESDRNEIELLAGRLKEGLRDQPLP